MKQRSVQIRLEVRNSFPCPLVRRNHRCEAPVLPRMFHSSFFERRCMCCASEAVHLHEKCFLHGALGRWYLATWQFLVEARTTYGLRYQYRAFGFFMTCLT